MGLPLLGGYSPKKALLGKTNPFVETEVVCLFPFLQRRCYFYPFTPC